MTGRSVTAYAPATISNLGPGFDILGVAIDAPGDTVFAQRRREPGIGFTLKTNQARVPENAQKNVAAHVARLMLREIKP